MPASLSGILTDREDAYKLHEEERVAAARERGSRHATEQFCYHVGM
jgi:hypothetical protein